MSKSSFNKDIPYIKVWKLFIWFILDPKLLLTFKMHFDLYPVYVYIYMYIYTHIYVYIPDLYEHPVLSRAKHRLAVSQ